MVREAAQPYSRIDSETQCRSRIDRRAFRVRDSHTEFPTCRFAEKSRWNHVIDRLHFPDDPVPHQVSLWSSTLASGAA